MKEERRLPFRAWINAPSTLQPYHKFHGMRGIVVRLAHKDVRFYPVTGNIISFDVLETVISTGWPKGK